MAIMIMNLKKAQRISQKARGYGPGWSSVTTVNHSRSESFTKYSLYSGTVVSIHENRGNSPLGNSRRNLINVFRQLSKISDAWRIDHPVNTLDIRPGVLSNQSSNVTISDSPGLLFYYLFDDWYTTYALVSREEQQYGERLENLVLFSFSLSC